MPFKKLAESVGKKFLTNKADLMPKNATPFIRTDCRLFLEKYMSL